MNKTLDHAYTRDQRVWDACAATYEQEIVGGHPDVTAYEAFEADLLERMLLFLLRDGEEQVHLLDVGCGSGRLHLHFGLKSLSPALLDAEESALAHQARQRDNRYGFDALLGAGLASIEGVDFSEAMLELGREKLRAAGLGRFLGKRFRFRQGSAFDLAALPESPVPLAVTVCNSIGVMQGPEGAAALFQSMRRAVEAAGGIAVISAYCGEAIESQALGNYESTLNVSGQPRWLEPDTYAGPEFVQVPRGYKRAHDPSDSICVDVYDRRGTLICEGFMLERNPSIVAETLRSRHIQTHTDYESYWYRFDEFATWIDQYWGSECTYHLRGRALDALRAAPVQLAIWDPAGRLKPWMARLLNENGEKG